MSELITGPAGVFRLSVQLFSCQTLKRRSITT